MQSDLREASMDTSPRILIVDDEPAIRTLLSSAFTEAGFEVKTAVDGQDAVDLLASEAFDVLLSDVMMPRMGGHDLVRWVAQAHPRTCTILMSGFDAGCENCPSSGRCVLLSKPFRTSEAVSAVARALAGGGRRCTV